jgi:hypothetical protein
MPPLGAPRPDDPARQAFVGWLEESLDRTASARTRPDRPLVHRLNRFEYTNAVRDLLALQIDGASLLPADESGYGFDNIADVLSMTPGLLERYLLASQKISRLAVGDSTMRPAADRIMISPHLPQLERESDESPFLSRGGAVIHRYFPADGEYALQIRLRRFFDGGTINGIDRRHQVDVRLDGMRVKLFSIGGECPDGSQEPRCVKSMRGLILPSSEYQRSADDALRVRFPAKTGMRVLTIAFPTTIGIKEGAGPVLPKQRGSANLGEMGVDYVDLEGPFNVSGVGDSASRRKIFICQPATAAAEEPCARKILAVLARQAYRGFSTAKDVETLLTFYQEGRKSGSLDLGIRFALEKLLVSPKFLLRVETVTPAAAQSVANQSLSPAGLSDMALASRLSFLLWSSIPDDELLDVAERGELRHTNVLEQQVRRMLADRRSIALVTNFASQWLYVRDLRKSEPDPILFPEWDDSLRQAFERETLLFLESQLRDDRPLEELLTANYTFVNERLARFYGIPHVYGSHFRRVTMTDPNRAGLLGHGSILTVTSYSTRTSPVVRGKYLLSNILGSPPPPPPANVPPLPETGGAAAPQTMRARMEAHRRNPVCAACHARMDPLGFALENFNPIGKWRVLEAGKPIDASGSFPDGSTFDAPQEFRKLLLTRRDEFIRAFTEKLLTYAIGRGVEYFDMPAVREIVRQAAPANFSWSSIILAVVKSAPFHMRSGMSAPRTGTRQAQRG